MLLWWQGKMHTYIDILYEFLLKLRKRVRLLWQDYVMWDVSGMSIVRRNQELPQFPASCSEFQNGPTIGQN